MHLLSICTRLMRIINFYLLRLPDFKSTKFSVDQNVIMDDNMLSSTDIESDSSVEHFSPRFNSPIDHNSSQSSKSQSSIEDLNKEIEKLFLNNSEKYGFSSFVWDQEVKRFFHLIFFQRTIYISLYYNLNKYL